MFVDKEIEYRKDEIISLDDSRLTKAINSLHLSPIPRISLEKANITLVGELIQLSEDYLLNTLKLKWISVSEIKKRLSEIGLSLGLIIPGWDGSCYKKESVSNSNESSLENINIETSSNVDEINSTIVLSINDQRLAKHIDELELSVRSVNCLKNEKINYVGELIQKTENDMLKIPNMGRKSLNEIKTILNDMGLSFGTKLLDSEDMSSFIEARELAKKQNLLQPDDSRLLKKIDELDLSVRAINCLKNDKVKYVGDLVQKNENYMLKAPNFGRKSLTEIITQLKTMGLSLGMEVPGWPPENLEELVAQQSVRNDVSFKDCMKEIEEYVQERCTDIEKSVYNQRIRQIHGATLQSLAEDINVTRERIRQIETKIISKILRIFYKNIPFLNKIMSEYGSIIDYSVDINDDITLIRQNCGLLYNLFKEDSTYNIDLKKQWLYKTADLPSFAIKDSNLYSMDELVEHISSNLSKIVRNDKIESKRNFTSILNKYVKQIIIDNFIFIDGKRTENTKVAVFRRFLSQYSLVPIDIDYLFKEYSTFLIHNNIDLKKYGYPKFTTFSNMVVERDDVLLSLGHKVRYYNCNAFDIKHLINQLNLLDYKDVEISCNKLFDENKELMADYNILSAHELHNLLKKHYNNDEADFSRMPIIKFGKVDRCRQVINFARTLAPISTTDLAAAYEEAFGIQQNTFISNYAQYLRDYIYRGQVIFDDEKQISEEEKNKILACLNKDFYFIRDVENVFKSIFADNYYEYMHQTILKSVGFYMTPLYILSMKYASLRDYINKTFDSMPIVDLNIYKEYKAIGAFENWFYNKRNNSDLIKFAYNKYISSAALEKVGITKDKLVEYSRQVLDCVQNRFFTIYSISDALNNSELESFGFEDVFYEDVLIQHARVSFTKINNVFLFKNTPNPISLSYFISSLMEHLRVINIYDLILKIKEEYGIFLTKHDITSLTEETDLYFNNITENLYVTYDEFITSF